MSLHGGPVHLAARVVHVHIVDLVVVRARLVVHVDNVPCEPGPALLVDCVLVLLVLFVPSLPVLIQLGADVFGHPHAAKLDIFNISEPSLIH